MKDQNRKEIQLFKWIKIKGIPPYLKLHTKHTV
jgi:hypothetical protein